MNEELIEKCRLSDEEFADAQWEYRKAQGKATAVWGNFPLKGQERDDCLQDTLLAKAIPLISAEAKKQERERILDYIDKHWFYSTCTNINGQTMTYRTLLDMDLQALKEGGKDKERVA